MNSMTITRFSLCFLLLFLSGCKLTFKAGPNGTIVENGLGYECADSCSYEPPDSFVGNYVAVANPNYRFAGWAGNACSSPSKYLDPECSVFVNPAIAALDASWSIDAHFTRKASLGDIENTPEFRISNFGFGGFYTTEIPPVICYPTKDNCSEGDRASWIYPDNYARGDFNNDGYEDIAFSLYMQGKYVSRSQKPGPVIFLNDKKGGLYRSDDIFANGKSEDMFFGYRMAVADFNGDGVDDLVVGPFGVLSREPDTYDEYFPERIALYLSGRGGKLYDASDLIEGQEDGKTIRGMSFAHDLSVGDIDGDGDLDLYMARQMLLNNGDGSFQRGFGLADDYSYLMSTLIGDFDGDNIGDLVINYGEGPEGSLSWLYLSNGNPDLRSRQATLLPEGRFGVMNTKHNHTSAADLDGDGDLDIVVGQTRVNPYYLGRALQVLINDGSGHFADETDDRLGDQNDYLIGKTANQGEGQVDLLDFNGDGNIDIFDRRGTFQKRSESDPSPAGASIWLNDGNGNFVDVPPTVFPFVEPRDMSPINGKDPNFLGTLMSSAAIDLDGKAGLDLVSWVETTSYPNWDFGESTMYSLTSRKPLRAADYID